MHRRTLGLLLLLVTVACYSDRSVGVAGRSDTDAPAPAKPKFPSKIVGQTGESLSLTSPLAGDMDGDGLDDFFVYAQRDGETDGAPRRPLLYLFYGKAEFPSQLSTADAEAAFEVDSGFSGAVGDLNGDGYTDALFSQFNAANFVFGSKQRLHGLIERSTGGVMWTLGALPPPFSYDQLIGWIVSAAGDVNGDGCADLIVSAAAIRDAETGEQIERGWVVPGHRGEWQDTKWDASSILADIGYGFAFASQDSEMNMGLLMTQPMGDVDGDGREDLLALNGAGSLMFYGKSEYPNELSISAADATLVRGSAVPAVGESPFGPILSARGLQDIDADGKNDLGLGATVDGYQIVYGRHWSGESTLEPELVISIAREKQVLDVASGDIDGDGLPELLLNVIDRSNVEAPFPTNAASVYVLRGTGERLHGEIQLSESDRWNMPVPEGASIQMLVLAGDIDGDGSQDILTSLPPTNLFQASGPVYLVPSTPRAPD